MIRSTLAVTKRTPLATRGMVVAEHPRGAEVGARILHAGGNAVDAAVATAFAMTVIEPFMSTIAGSGTMLIHLAKRGETIALDFNAVAPLRAHGRMYKVVGGVSEALFPWPNVDGQANVFGHRAVAVPGSVAGLATAIERYGTMSLADVMAPAIEIAREDARADFGAARVLGDDHPAGGQRGALGDAQRGSDHCWRNTPSRYCVMSTSLPLSK